MQDTASPNGSQRKGDNRANATNNNKAPLTKTGNNSSGTQSAWPELNAPTPTSAKVRPSACHPMPGLLCAFVLGLRSDS